jgi:hypothetical protein
MRIHGRFPPQQGEDRMIFRFLYNRFGEILTLAVCLCIGLYLVNTFSGAAAVTDNEDRAYEVLKEVYRLEMQAARDRAYLPLEQLLERSEKLEGVKKREISGLTASTLFGDGKYYFLFRLEHKTQSAQDYIAGRDAPLPIGFQLLAWPRAFAHTGEIALYVDQRGQLMVTGNDRAKYDGLKTFPPDMKEPAEDVTRQHLREKENVALHPQWRRAESLK